MTSPDEQNARDTLNPLIDAFIRDNILKILKMAQENASAKEVMRGIWPGLTGDDTASLLSADPEFLIRTSATPKGMELLAEKLFFEALPPKVIEFANSGHRYAKGGKFHRVVKGIFKRKAQLILDEADQFFEKRSEDKFADPKVIRSLVTIGLNDACIQELKELESAGLSANEQEAKRHLKILTVLTANIRDRVDQKARLPRIETGNTWDFPFVLKYLKLGQEPGQIAFANLHEPETGIISDDLKKLIPEAVPVEAALNSYLNEGGIISTFLDANAGMAEGSKSAFDLLPSHIPTAGGILLPKAECREVHRKIRYSLPDGIVCLIGLTILLESLLRQVQQVTGVQGSSNLRPKELIPRLQDALPFSRESVELLKIVFDQAQIALRDAAAHGVFVANDDETVRYMVGGLLKCLAVVSKDIANSAFYPAFVAGQPWSAGTYLLPPQHEKTFLDQFEGSNMLDQQWIPNLQKHSFDVIRSLIPDKAPLCRAGCLIWVNLGRNTPGALSQNPAAEFVGMIAGLISLEELFRAVQEHYGQRVLYPSAQPDNRVKCQLAILDDSQGQILDPEKLAAIFGVQWNVQDFQESIAAVRSLRDNVLHGGWAGLSHPKKYYIHLIVKLIFTLCSTVNIKPQK